MTRRGGSSPVRGSRGPGLAVRLAAQLCLLSVLITAGVAWLSHTLVRSSLESGLRDELGATRDRFDREMDSLESELRVSLRGLEEHLRRADPGLLEALLLGDSGSADAAIRLLPLSGLDWLELVSPERGVISSAPWRERAGLAAGSAGSGIDAGRAGLLTLGDATGGRLGLVARHPVRVGSRMLLLDGGAELDEPFLGRVAGGGAALLLNGTGQKMAATRAGAALDLRAGAGTADGDGVPFRLTGAEGTRWEGMRIPLAGESGPRVGSLVIAVDHGRVDSILDRLIHGFLLLGAAAGLVSALAGIGIARRVSRPVRDLVRAFDAVAAGEADYSLPTSRQDELQELIGSVSRLQRALERQQQRSVAAERVATWRDVARHVAHEVKNPLAPIRLTVENLIRARRKAPERFDAMFEEGMRTILEEVEQLRRMVEEFSAFARLPLPALAPTDLERLLDGVLDLYASVSGLEIRRDYCGGLSGLPLDADQISRALKNIVGNAVESLSPAGDGGPARIEVRTVVEEGMARIDVADNGPGFSGEAATKMFEPYFSTKPEGTGLGLALTYRIIIEHGGAIAAGNRDGGGARVTLRLPLRPGSAGAADRVGENA